MTTTNGVSGNSRSDSPSFLNSPPGLQRNGSNGSYDWLPRLETYNEAAIQAITAGAARPDPISVPTDFGAQSSPNGGLLSPQYSQSAALQSPQPYPANGAQPVYYIHSIQPSRHAAQPPVAVQPLAAAEATYSVRPFQDAASADREVILESQDVLPHVDMHEVDSQNGDAPRRNPARKRRNAACTGDVVEPPQRGKYRKKSVPVKQEEVSSSDESDAPKTKQERNKIAARKSRAKKKIELQELQEQVGSLNAKVTSLSRQLVGRQQRVVDLTTENALLKKQIEELTIPKSSYRNGRSAGSTDLPL